MKWLVIAFFFITTAQARTMDLLKCLGAEEKRLHLKKDTGPTYDLNQKLIAEIIQVPHVSIDPEILKTICESKTSESWKLLQLSLIRGRSIFVIPSSLPEMQKQITSGMIGDYLEAVREILLNLIGQIQSLAPTPDCLTTEFPRLVSFFRDLKYLQEDVDIRKIFENRDEKIFNDLSSYKKALKKCQERLKKKLNSPSSSALKKT